MLAVEEVVVGQDYQIIVEEMEGLEDVEGVGVVRLWGGAGEIYMCA